MKNPLSKRIPRDFAKNWVKYIGMMIILICTIAVGSSFQTTLNGAEKYLDNIKEGNFQEDGLFEMSNPISDSSIQYLER